MYGAPLGVELAILLYALIIGAGAVLMARRRLRWMWIAGSLLAVAAFLVMIPIPVWMVNRRVCPYGWAIDSRAFALSMLVTAAVVHPTARRSIPLWRRVLIAVGAAYPLLRIGMGAWVE